MKKLIKPLIFLILLGITCVSFAVEAKERKDYFSVSIQQDGKIIPIKDHTVRLKKKPFTILLYFPKIDDINIYVNASRSSESYNAARQGKPMEEIPGFHEKFGMAEYRFNRERTLMLSKSAPHYWYYSKDDDHRFDEVYPKDGKWLCRRIAANIMNRDTKRDYKNIENFDGNRLYMVFLKGKYTKDYSNIIENQREYLEIDFE